MRRPPHGSAPTIHDEMLLYGFSSQVVDFPGRVSATALQGSAMQAILFTSVRQRGFGAYPGFLSRSRSELASFRISQTDEETHRYRLESIESKTPAHSLCDRGKESRLQQGPSGPCFTVSIWLAPTTDSASSSDCGKLASVRVDLRDDLSGKCLTADNLSEGRDVDITTSAGKVSGIFHTHLARPRGVS